MSGEVLTKAEEAVRAAASGASIASDETARIGKLLRQQAAIARFGTFALSQTNLMTVLTEAAGVCAEGLNVPFCKICRYRVEENDLFIEAGCGWQEGVVGHAISPTDASTPQGLAFITGKPAICRDLRDQSEFRLPPFYSAHGIISTIDVIIKGVYQPYGVLEVDSSQQHDYDEHDVDFLTGFANVLAEAVSTSERTALLRTTLERMQELVQEKDRLLDQKRVLAQELQHRVRNNLQLVYGMLSKQLEETADKEGQRGLRAIARRVSTLAQVYDQLLGTEMTPTLDFGKYIQSLCLNIAEIQASPQGDVALDCDCETVSLKLDAVTALGIIVAELLTNSYDHAFPGGKGSIAISLRRAAATGGMARMIIRDDGPGFEPQAESKRHGLGLVRRLVQQVHGSLSLKASHGTAWTIDFPVADTAIPA